MFFVVVLFAACSQKPAETTPQDSDADMILFFSNTCPHCLKVEDFIKANNIKDKIEFSQLEVGMLGKAKENSNLMVEKQKECKLDEKSLGAIPFFWAKDGTCLLGDVDIIEYLKSKAGEPIKGEVSQ